MFGMWSRFPYSLGDDQTYEQGSSNESFELNCFKMSDNVLKYPNDIQTVHFVESIAAKCSNPEIGRAFNDEYYQKYTVI